MIVIINQSARDVIFILAQQRHEIDLDDGVKVNYLKFEGAVQPIPGGEGRLKSYPAPLLG